MTKNFLNRTITSFFLLSILLFINFSHYIVFILSILILGIIVCIEANNIFLKLIVSNSSKSIAIKKNINFRYLALNVITFGYVFFIFCQYSYKIHSLESPSLFIYIVCICIFTDIGGYVFGKTIGGKKLTKISPNKTISGTMGSFISCLLPFIIFLHLGYFGLEFNLKNIFFCFLISLIRQLGDLFISYLKRKAKIKDTGKILPGHGGALDRVDGIIFAVPFSYFLLELI